MNKTIIASLAALVAIASLAATPANARRGADDPAGHNQNDDRGGRHGGRHGADDSASHNKNDDHGRHGANHK